MSSQDESLFGEMQPAWSEHWQGMPEFAQKDLMPWHSLKINFANQSDMQSFSMLVGQKIFKTTKSIWYPEAEIGRLSDKEYTSSEPVNPRYPIYIISKGRWESRHTSKSLEKIGVPYRIVIEPQERTLYEAVIDPAKILVLPFSNLGQGSIPARNWVWEHSKNNGDARHWILDDNIDGFFRLNGNLKVPVKTGSTFVAAESFADRYTNIALCGFNYFMFAKRKDVIPPFILNTRIYSCILIQNDIPYRWRGRYNEDTDLSLRVLKDGYCTVLFNAFLAFKQTTMTMSGGNTDELYKGNGRFEMARSLRDQHPDIVTITKKWGRPQHHINYKIFRLNKLKLRPDAAIHDAKNNFGMYLKMLEESDKDQNKESAA